MCGVSCVPLEGGQAEQLAVAGRKPRVLLQEPLGRQFGARGDGASQRQGVLAVAAVRAAVAGYVGQRRACFFVAKVDETASGRATAWSVLGDAAGKAALCFGR